MLLYASKAVVSNYLERFLRETHSKAFFSKSVKMVKKEFMEESSLQWAGSRTLDLWIQSFAE